MDPDLPAELTALAKRRLAEQAVLRPTAAVEARWIVDHAIAIADHGEHARALASDMVSQRMTGRPLSRIFGHGEFYGLAMAVSQDTLDPRNDTEALVDLVLSHCDDQPRRVLDLGTGTGCILLALLHHRASWRGLGVDAAVGAIDQAIQNAKALGFVTNDDDGAAAIAAPAAIAAAGARVGFVQSHWFSALPAVSQQAAAFDIIVSNPPYLSADDMDKLDTSVAGYDPHLALYGGVDGLDAYRAIAKDAAKFMHNSSCLAVEIGATQRQSVIQIMAQCDFVLTGERQDLGKRDRALLFGHAN